MIAPSDEKRREFEHALGALIERYGGTRAPALEASCVEHILAALHESAADGSSLSPLDVVRIRAGKFAATRVPSAVFRTPAQLAALRADLHAIALSFVGSAGALGSRF